MPEASAIDPNRIAFGKYINDQVIPPLGEGGACPYHDSVALREKKARYKLIAEALSQSDEFQTEVSSWLKSNEYGLAPGYKEQAKKNVEERGYGLSTLLSGIFIQVQGNIDKAMKFQNFKQETEVFDQLMNMKAGMINALASQLGWTFVTIKKMKDASVEQIAKVLENNKKAMRTMSQMQFGLFNFFLNKLDVFTFPFMSFHKFNENKLELIDSGKSKVLVPTKEVVEETIRDARKPDARFEMHGAATLDREIAGESMPLGCPAFEVEMKNGTKANLGSEFIDYIDRLITDLVLPNLDKLRENDAENP